MKRIRRNRRGFAALAAALLVVLAGCGAGLPAGEDGGDTGAGTESNTGTVNFYISDQKNAIDQFEHLNVTVSAVTLVRADGETGTATPGDDDAGDETAENETAENETAENGTAENETAENGTATPEEANGERVTYEVDNVTVDLTELQGANATQLGAIDAPEGTYTQVVVEIENVDGTLTDGSSAEVKLPSERLRLNKQFTVGNGEAVDFVFDVTVFERGPNGYILRPVAGESGTGDEVEIHPVERRNGSANAGGGNGGGEGASENGDDGANRGDGDDGNGDANADTRGSMSFYVSDQKNAIDQFEHLNATITQIGVHRVEGATEAENDTENESAGDGAWVERDVNATVDLTELQGANATKLDEFGVANGTYNNVFIHVESVEGTLTDGSEADVKLPSNRLKLNKQFTVGNGEAVDFVFDVTVFERGPNGYIVKPVAGESGTGDEVDIAPVDGDESDDGDGDETADDGALNASFVGNVSAGENATVEVTRNGTAVENATVNVTQHVDGEVSAVEYATDADGTATFRVEANATELTVRIVDGDAKAELEREFETVAEETTGGNDGSGNGNGNNGNGSNGALRATLLG